MTPHERPLMRRSQLTTSLFTTVTAIVLTLAVFASAAETDKPASTGTDKKPAAKDTNGATGMVKPTATIGAKKPAKDPATALITEAVEKLTAEYKATQKKEGGGGSLRTTSDYFTEVPAELTPEKVLAAVSKSYGSDPVLDAYVRWQLLSAIPGTLEDKLLSKGVNAYRSAPRPLTRVGASADERKRLDQAIKGDNVNIDTINSKFNEAVDRRAAMNAPIYSFRDDLFSKLPASPDAFIAGLGDAMDRFHAGDNKGGNNQLKLVGQRVTLWSVSVENPRQRAVVADAVERLRKEPGVEYAQLVEPGEGGRPRWKLGMARPSKDELNNIIESMKGAAAFDVPAEKGKKKQK